MPGVYSTTLADHVCPVRVLNFSAYLSLKSCASLRWLSAKRAPLRSLCMTVCPVTVLYDFAIRYFWLMLYLSLRNKSRTCLLQLHTVSTIARSNTVQNNYYLIVCEH